MRQDEVTRGSVTVTMEYAVISVLVHTDASDALRPVRHVQL